MTAIQATLGQFFSSRRPISWWLQHIRAIPPIPYARQAPIIEIDGYSFEGAEGILAFWYCAYPRPLSHPLYDPCPEIMTSIYDLAQQLIADGWIVEACDITPWRGQEVDVRLIVYRWIAGEVLSGRYLLNRASPLGGEAAPIRCSSHFPSEAIV